MLFNKCFSSNKKAYNGVVKFTAIVFLFPLTSLNLFGINTDSTLTFGEYLQIVKENHPIALQAELTGVQGELKLQASRGYFDPKAFTTLSQKYFDDKQYYSHIHGGLKLPTWFGVELKSGIEQNEGVLLNPEQSTPNGGLWYAGISLPIGQGLFIDERRKSLRQAQAYLNIAKAERQNMLNQLFFAAGKAYWDWFSAYNKKKVFEKALALAKQRFRAVEQGAIAGDRPFIDTVEAGIQVQNRRLSLQQANLELNNTTANLSVFLWDEGMIPLTIAENTVPEERDKVKINNTIIDYVVLVDSINQKHPLLQKYVYKLQEQEIEKRWKKEQLKPILNLNYNPLTENITSNTAQGFNLNDYKWGVNFNMPLLLRKERNELKLASVTIEQTKIEAYNKNAILTAKAKMAYNEMKTTASQIGISINNVADYNKLLEGERQLFNIGESSLFMVNSREVGYISSQLKLIELIAKNKKAWLTTYYSLGVLWKE